MSWTEIAKTLRSTANLGRTDGEHATTAPRLDCHLKTTLKPIQGTLTSPTSAVRLDLASGLLVVLNPTRGEDQQGASRCVAGPSMRDRSSRLILYEKPPPSPGSSCMRQDWSLRNLEKYFKIKGLEIVGA
jgi:hypothetical protein